jgi:hypothetical protein
MRFRTCSKGNLVQKRVRNMNRLGKWYMREGGEEEERRKGGKEGRKVGKGRRKERGKEENRKRTGRGQEKDRKRTGRSKGNRE